MNLWPVEHFFSQFGVPVYCKVPQIEKKSVQLRFIHKEVTSYKIHNLINHVVFETCWPDIRTRNCSTSFQEEFCYSFLILVDESIWK